MNDKHDPLPFDALSWLSDPEVLDMDPETRGVLIDVMALAHIGRPYGFLMNAGKPLSDEKVCRVRRIHPDVWRRCKAALMAGGCVAESDTGAMFVPRMVREGNIRQSAREGGSLGGNPSLVEPQKPTRKITAELMFKSAPEKLQVPAFREAIEEWMEYRRRKEIVMTELSMRRQLNILGQLTADEAVRWVHCAIDKNWRGFYPPPADHKTERKRDDGTDHGRNGGMARTL